MAQKPQDTDEQIVHKVIHGDIEAYGLLMARYESKLLRYTVYLLRNQAAASDAVQMTFIKAYQNLRGFNTSYRFAPWLYRIAHNEAMNYVKKQSHMSETDIDLLPEQAYDVSMESELDQQFLRRDVQKCVLGLDQKYRDVIQLAFFEHMKYEEISDVLHIPTSTVGVRINRAKAILRKLCESKGVTR